MQFQLTSPFQPAGDQPQAIAALTEGLRQGRKQQVLMGVTGSGKTFTMANVIQNLQRPTLVLSHNKTLAAQLYTEFKEFFPHNAVHYFVSYYDYYQPEAYIPQRDIYIEKDASINQEIDRLRLATTSSLVSRRDVIIVASVSCIYGLGSPEDYSAMMVALRRGMQTDRDDVLRKLIDIQYERNDIEFARGKFRVRGDCVELWPSYEEFAYRIEFWGDEIEKLSIINPTSGETIDQLEEVYIYPAKHFVMPEDRIRAAVDAIKQELDQRLEEFKNQGKLLEAQRLGRPHALRYRNDARNGLLPRHRKLQPPALRPPAGKHPRHALQFFPERLSAVRRRIARHRAAGARHVRRRPQPQEDARRARLPPAQRPGQPAAEVRRMGSQDQTGDLRLGHAGALRIGKNRRRSRRASHPPDRPAWIR